ncbi:MAG: hypothetical protein PHX21_12660 [bacterium]|nr:hypothetical protein [bacterium]
MDDFQKGWLSALIDGEGTVGVYFQKQKTSSRPNVRCIITICNTNEEVLQFTQKITGGSICKKTGIENRKNIFVLTIWSKKLREILPLPLIVKREQQKILLEVLSLLGDKGGRNKDNKPRTRPLWKDQKLLELKLKMNLLNLRGKKRITDDYIITTTNNEFKEVI